MSDNQRYGPPYYPDEKFGPIPNPILDVGIQKLLEQLKKEQEEKALRDSKDVPSKMDGRYRKAAEEIGKLVEEKQLAYGNSFGKAGEFLKLLYPNGIRPEQYGDALTIVRIFDKLMRIATDKNAFGESPYRDIAGYAILGAVADSNRAPAPKREIAD